MITLSSPQDWVSAFFGVILMEMMQLERMMIWCGQGNNVTVYLWVLSNLCPSTGNSLFLWTFKNFKNPTFWILCFCLNANLSKRRFGSIFQFVFSCNNSSKLNYIPDFVNGTGNGNLALNGLQSSRSSVCIDFIKMQLEQRTNDRQLPSKYHKPQ